MRSLRVFIVDDDRDFAESLADLLHLEGHEADIAHTGEAAVERLQREDFDVAFMDVRLPGRDGVRSFQEIHRVKPDVPVYMMTGFSVDALLSEALAGGARGVLHKPLDIDGILTMLRRLGVETVLLVDDDPDYAEGTRDMLEQSGYRVCVASDGCQAIDRIGSGGISLVILDLRLPGLSGLEVYERLLASGQTPPTLFVTAYAAEEQAAIRRIAELSIGCVLSKPHDPRALLDAVDSLAQC